MIKSVRIIACGLALALGSTGLASALSDAPRATATSTKMNAENGEKRLQRHDRRQRHDYRGRDRQRSHDRHDRRDYRDGYRRHHRDDFRGSRHYRPHCWSDTQRSHFRGRPALVSVRVCRDRHGRVYAVRGSTRLIRYLRGHRRHW